MKISKTTISKTKYFLLALVVAFSFSCSPEDGNDGATGPAGADGVDGVDGADGNANVFTSPWLTSGDWDTSGIEAFFDRNAPEVTQSIIDRGVVLAYTKLIGDGTNVRPLPANIEDNVWSYHITTVSNIRFTTTVGSPSTSNVFRYIVIPSNNSTKMENADFSKMSYEEVMDYFNLDY